MIYLLISADTLCVCCFFFQYILNDKISYPDETFMDMEFKISVMYDIAKVFALPCPRIMIEIIFEKDLLSTH